MITNKMRLSKSNAQKSPSTFPVLPVVGTAVIVVGSYIAYQILGPGYLVAFFIFIALAGLIWTEHQGRVHAPEVSSSLLKQEVTQRESVPVLQKKEPFISEIDEDDINLSEPEIERKEDQEFMLELQDPGDDPVAVTRILHEKLNFSTTKAKDIIVAKQFPVSIAKGDKRDLTVKSLLLKKAGARSVVVKQESSSERIALPRAIGYWITLISEKELYPPHDFVGEYEAGVKELVVGYLESGEVYKSHKGLSWCRFNCGVPDTDLGQCELTDGQWIWPEGLSHYVKEHNVLLPTEFIEHVKLGGSELTTQLDPDVKPDFEYWLEWCKTHSSGKGSLMIRKAREHADALGQKGQALLRKYRDKRATLVEAAIGLSDAPCQVNGCKRRALKGMTFCGEHHMNPFMGKSTFKPDAEFFELSKKHKQFHDALEKFTNLKYVLNRPAS